MVPVMRALLGLSLLLSWAVTGCSDVRATQVDGGAYDAPLPPEIRTAFEGRRRGRR